MKEQVDLGNGFSMKFADWEPDRSIKENARRFFGIPNCPRICIILTCRHGVEGVVHLDRGDMYKTIFGEREWWKVIQEEPLTLEPSIQTGCCHGFIREGKWVDA